MEIFRKIIIMTAEERCFLFFNFHRQKKADPHSNSSIFEMPHFSPKQILILMLHFNSNDYIQKKAKIVRVLITSMGA